MVEGFHPPSSPLYIPIHGGRWGGRFPPFMPDVCLSCCCVSNTPPCRKFFTCMSTANDGENIGHYDAIMPCSEFRTGNTRASRTALPLNWYREGSHAANRFAPPIFICLFIGFLNPLPPQGPSGAGKNVGKMHSQFDITHA